MTFKCIGCKRTFDHKSGLSNHRRVCLRWKNYDNVTMQKKRRIEQQQDDAVRLSNLEQTSRERLETQGQLRHDTLSTEVF